MKTHTFHVNGMHCNSCIAFIESTLGGVQDITQVKASLKSNTVSISGKFENKDPEALAISLSSILKSDGYSLSMEKQKHAVDWSQFKIALPIAAAFITLFIVLQKIGLVNLVTSSNVGYGTAFLIGIIASVSTCMAVVGGLVLSMSANYAKENNKVRPQALFHIGRLVSFFVLGGVIGAIGSAFELNGTGTFILSLFVAIILLILGINLLDVFPWAKRLQPSLPSFMTKHVQGLKKVNHTLTPVLIGVATFFLPCGFTQSMQIYSLSTGSFWTGAMTMLFFALGTLPVLAILSFSSLGIHDKVKSGVFFKSAGLIVLFFAAFNLINSLVAIGAISPVFNF